MKQKIVNYFTLDAFQLYIQAADGNLVDESEICACKPGTEAELVCAVITPVPDKPCNTNNIFYRLVDKHFF